MSACIGAPSPGRATPRNTCERGLTPSLPARGLHGMVGVMTAAESARDLMSTVTQPVSYSELAAHLARDYSEELFDSLSGLVLCHVDELSGPELSNVLWAYTTVGHHDSGLVTAILQSLAGKLPELGPVELANALWALSRLGLYDPQFVSAVSEHVWDGLPAATPRQLAAIVQSYAWFRQHDPQLEEDEDLLRSIAAKFRAQVVTASATEVALVLSGMARLRRADTALLTDACAALRRLAPDAGLEVLAEAMWACALLQHRDLGLMGVVAERVAEAQQVATGLVPVPAAMAAGVPSSSQSLPLRAEVDGNGVADAAAAPAAAAVDGSAAHGPSQGAGLRRDHGSPNQQHQLPQQPPAHGSGSGHHPADAHESGVRSSGAVGRAPAKLLPPPLKASKLLLPPGRGLPADMPVLYSALWPTHIGPGGRSHSCSLYDRFNPALPDDWHAGTARGDAGGSAPFAESGRFVNGTTVLPSGKRASSESSHAFPGAVTPPTPGAAPAAAEGAASALLDADVLSKLLWSYGALHCYSASLSTLLFRQLPRLHPDSMSWSALARLMGAQVKALELQPGQGMCRINPLEAESVTAWSRLLRTRPPVHKLPERFLSVSFVAFQAEAAGRDTVGTHGAADPTQHPMPGQALSRVALQAEVAATLRAMGLELRPSASIDGMFNLKHTMLINGLTICLEVLSAGCCTLDAPHRPMGPAAARLRSLEFRGWTPLVVPFHEWSALAADDSPPALARQAGPDGEVRRVRALQEAAAARQRYLRSRLEELLGEELPPLPQKAAKRRMC